MRLLIIALGLGLVLANTLLAEPPAAGKDTAADAGAAGAVLDRRLPELRFDNVGLSDVIDFLRDLTGAKFFVNWKKIEAAGVDRNTPVSARMRDIPLRKVLDHILDSAGGKVKLAWTVDEGVITITTAEELGRNVVTRTYDIGSLESRRKNAAPATRPTDAKDPLIGMITGSIAPTTWGKDGPGKITELNGQLIVTATDENHQLIANLLENLKRLAK